MKSNLEALKEQTISTICVRGGSKGVPGKNIRELGGKPLLAHTIEHALESGLFFDVVVSTDCEKIQKIARKWGAKSFFLRAKDLAGDSAAKIPVIRDALIQSEEYFGREFLYLVDLDATAPVRTREHLLEGFEKFLQGNHSNLITATPSRKHPGFNMVERKADGRVERVMIPEADKVRRQDCPPCYDMNASFYIWKRDCLLYSDSLFHEKTGLYVMPEETSFDIDSELDWFLVECLLEKMEKDGF